MRLGEPRGEHYGPNAALVRHFLARLESMPARAMFRAVWRWRTSVGRSRWLEAEEQTGRALATAGRQRHHEEALDRLAAVFEQARWFRAAPTREALGTASAPAAHYVAATALAALAARDLLPESVFRTLYDPFAEMVPVAELEAAASAEQRDLPQ